MSIVTLCRVCANDSTLLMSGDLINENVTYFECSACGYVQTQDPTWLDRAYSSAINLSDTGIMMRNQVNANIVLATLFVLNALNLRVVDCAGGYGILVRLLRDRGVDALWSDRYCENLLAKGFEHKKEKASLVTSFESFEHFVNPAEELDRMLGIAPNILLSTEIIARPAPAQSDWWYYGKEHGQHIGFFRVETLQKLAADRGKYLLTDGRSYHLISDKKINIKIWTLARLVFRIFPSVTRFKLKSKTWDDHQKMVDFE